MIVDLCRIVCKVTFNDFNLLCFQAMVLASLAEHSLPFTMAPVIVDLAQTLAEDKVALSRMKLSRTTAKYKMVQGLGKTFSERIFGNTAKGPFSINLDESTSSSYKKVIIVLLEIPSIYTVRLTPNAINNCLLVYTGAFHSGELLQPREEGC